VAENPVNALSLKHQGSPLELRRPAREHDPDVTRITTVGREEGPNESVAGQARGGVNDHDDRRVHAKDQTPE
jgi:hypothetical protein